MNLLRLRMLNPPRVRENMLLSLSSFKTQNSLKLLKSHLVIVTERKTDIGDSNGYVTFVANQVTLDLFAISF